jgi:hypothetical protein
MDLIAPERNKTINAEGVCQYALNEIASRLFSRKVDDDANGAIAHLLVQTPVVSLRNPNAAILDLSFELYSIHRSSPLIPSIPLPYCSTAPLLLKVQTRASRATQRDSFHLRTAAEVVAR